MLNFKSFDKIIELSFYLSFDKSSEMIENFANILNFRAFVSNFRILIIIPFWNIPSPSKFQAFLSSHLSSLPSHISNVRFHPKLFLHEILQMM